MKLKIVDKAILAGLTVFLIILAISLFAHRARSETPIPSSGFMVTQGVSVSQADKERVAKRFKALQDAWGAQLASLIIDTLGDEGIEEYSIRVARAWGLGKAGVDDGILIIVATRDRKVRIEVGRGLEHRLTDGRALEITSKMKSRLAVGAWADAMIIAADYIDQVLRETKADAITRNETQTFDWTLFFLLVIPGAIVLFAFNAMSRNRARMKRQSDELERILESHERARMESKVRGWRAARTDSSSRRNLSSRQTNTSLTPVVVPVPGAGSWSGSSDSGSSGSSGSSWSSGSSDSSTSWSGGGGGDFSGGGTTDSF